MPSAMEVLSEKWLEVCVLFDNGTYSVIAGTFGGEDRLGERWNRSPDQHLGFPNVERRPEWHLVPRFLEIPILHGLLHEFAKNPTHQTGLNGPDRIMQEIKNRS
jgi:hypothetical protein